MVSVEMDNKYYKNIYEAFEEARPDVAKTAVCYHPRGEHSIRVKTKDDGYFDYNFIRGMGQYVRDKPKSIEEYTSAYTHKVFAEKLRDMMVKRGFSQKTLAAASGLSEAIISKYLRVVEAHGECARKTPVSPTYNALQRLCYALDCEPYELM